MNKIILLLLVIFSIQGSSQTTELKLVSDVWPPFTNIEGKKAFAIDLVTEALNRIGVNTKIEIIVSGIMFRSSTKMKLLWDHNLLKEWG